MGAAAFGLVPLVLDLGRDDFPTNQALLGFGQVDVGHVGSEALEILVAKGAKALSSSVGGQIGLVIFL